MENPREFGNASMPRVSIVARVLDSAFDIVTSNHLINRYTMPGTEFSPMAQSILPLPSESEQFSKFTERIEALSIPGLYCLRLQITSSLRNVGVYRHRG